MGGQMTRPRMTRRTVWLSSLSVAAVGAAGLAATYGRKVDTVRWGTVIGTLGALRTVLPSVEKKYSLQYDIKDFRDSTAGGRAVAMDGPGTHAPQGRALACV